jgi:hypothetical protein
MVEAGPFSRIARAFRDPGDPGEAPPLLDARLVVEHFIALRPNVIDQLADLAVDCIAED